MENKVIRGKSFFISQQISYDIPGRYYGMEMNVEKTKVMRISRQPSPVTITVDQKQLENVKCFKYLGSMCVTVCRHISTGVYRYVLVAI